MTWREYRVEFRRRIEELSDRLSSETWTPSAVRFAAIPFPDKTLDIVVPTVEDRVVHRAVRNALETPIAAGCAPFVFGWLPRRPWERAVDMAAGYLRCRRWVVDADVRRATGGTDADDVVNWLIDYTCDERLLRLVRLILTGLPHPLAPGGGLTPMLTNLRLVPIDRELQEHRVVRFTDNFCIFTYARREALRAQALLALALDRARLSINEHKSCIRWNPDPVELFTSGCVQPHAGDQ